MSMAPAAPIVPQLNAFTLVPFVDEMPLPERIRPDSTNKLRITMREVRTKIHRDVPTTRQWSYGETDRKSVV